MDLENCDAPKIRGSNFMMDSRTLFTTMDDSRLTWMSSKYFIPHQPALAANKRLLTLNPLVGSGVRNDHLLVSM